MNKTLKYIQDKFELDLNQKSPIKLPIDKYRGFTGLLTELGFKVGAEIGVCKGRYSKWLIYKMRRNKPKLFCVDPYKSYEEYSEHLKQEEMDVIKAEAHTRLASLNCEFIEKMSLDAVNDFLDNSLDFVYIDANHEYKHVVDDIYAWEKKVKVGGIVSGHDYSQPFYQVKNAVDGWVASKKIKHLFITEKNSNWFYVKEELKPAL